MEMTDDAFLRYVDHERVVRVLSDAGLLSRAGIGFARHCVGVSAGCWAAMIQLPNVEATIVPQAMFGALLHDIFRLRRIIAVRDRSFTGAVAPENVRPAMASQYDFLRSYRWRNPILDCARPVNFNSWESEQEKATPGRRILLLAHEMAIDEGSIHPIDIRAGQWPKPVIAANDGLFDGISWDDLSYEAPRLFHLALGCCGMLNEDISTGAVVLDL